MAKFICNSIEYILAENTEIDISGVVVPKAGYQYNEMYSSEKSEYSETAKSESGNILYSQLLKIVYRYKSITELQNLNDRHFILRLQLNGDYFIWGSLKPFNPVRLNMNLSEGFSDLEFFRFSEKPEN